MGLDHETLVVDRLSVRYGKVTSVRGASLQMNCGQVIALIGPNSAGKSSLLEALGAKIPGRTIDGAASLGSQPIMHLSTRERWQAGIRLVPQGRQIFPSLTVADNLRVIAENMKVNWKEALESSFSRFPPQFRDRLKERLRIPAGNLSGGEQQMLALARVLIGKVNVVLLDEPGLGLAPRIIQELGIVIGNWASQGIGVLMADQALRRWATVVNKVYSLVRGNLSELNTQTGSFDQLIAE